MYKKTNNKGISLMVLVITIVIIMIIAVAIILTLTYNNPIENANKAVFINDVATFKEQLAMYKNSEYINLDGDYKPKTLFANETELFYKRLHTTRKKYIYGYTNFRKIRKI